MSPLFPLDRTVTFRALALGIVRGGQAPGADGIEPTAPEELPPGIGAYTNYSCPVVSVLHFALLASQPTTAPPTNRQANSSRKAHSSPVTSISSPSQWQGRSFAPLVIGTPHIWGRSAAAYRPSAVPSRRCARSGHTYTRRLAPCISLLYLSRAFLISFQ